VFDTIEAEPERLLEVTGIGAAEPAASLPPGRARRSLAKLWSCCTVNGVGTARAVRILKTYGAEPFR
jgi:exodeoxyribonuclease V alpha subunit